MDTFKEALAFDRTNKDHVSSAVFVTGGKVWLGYSPKKGCWCTAGGKCEEGEVMESCVRREAAEEAGITEMKIVKFLGVVPNPTNDKLVHIFICETDQTPQLMAPDEISQWKLFDLDDMPECVINKRAFALMASEKSKHTHSI